MGSPELPPPEAVTKKFFLYTILGTVLWLGAVSFFVLSRTP